MFTFLTIINFLCMLFCYAVIMAIFFDNRVQAPFPGSSHDCQWHKTHGLLAVASHNPTTGAAVTVYQEEVQFEVDRFLLKLCGVVGMQSLTSAMLLY